MSRRPAPRPDPLPLSERLISDLWRLPLFTVGTVLCGSLSLAVSLLDRSGALQHRIARRWAKYSLWCSGSKVTVLHPERLAGHGGAVFVSNHLSYMDTPVIYSSLPFQFRIVARQSLWKIPFIGWHLHRSGQIPVNVGNPRASIASLGGGVKTLLGGMPLFIFPEGGRSRTGYPGEFLNGPAFMAIRARVPVVPMAIVGTFELLPIHARRFHPVAMVLVVGEAISTTGYTAREVEQLTRRIAESVERLYFAHTYLDKSNAGAAKELEFTAEAP